MTTIVTDNCQKCRFTDCVTVCPVECFHYDDEMLYIDPDVCIDCSACIPECPVEAEPSGVFVWSTVPQDVTLQIYVSSSKCTSFLTPSYSIPDRLQIESGTGFVLSGSDEQV